MSASESEIQARLLVQALPFMQRYENKTIVVKYGGHAMGNPELGKAFAADIALLKQSGVNPIVVHGGGPQIGAMLARMGIESRFENGLRVTDQKTVEIVEMVLAGSINKEIVALINQTGEWAIGLCGKDGNMVFAEKAQKKVRDPDSNIERVLDLGFVGDVVEVDRTLLEGLDRVLAVGGNEDHVAGVADLARRLDTGLAGHPDVEEGYVRPDWVTFEAGGVNGHSTLPRDPQWYLETAASLPPVPTHAATSMPGAPPAPQVHEGVQ